MYDIPLAAVGRAILPEEGVVEHERPSGMKVYCTALGVADLDMQAVGNFSSRA